MPLYECATTEGALTDEQRAEIADGITRAHVDITGAPFEFVHVAFPELPAGRTFTGGKPASPILIRGNIRAGRTDEVRHELMRRIYEIVSTVTGIEPTRLLVAVADFPPNWAMEAGMILPATTPEAEQEFIAKLRSADAGAVVGA
ncbi:tautomerase family protein [Mycobacterium sp. 236(2023)]|uniref:tautomerase family protein n=1 Tax=Mycobacterium sp. 236(2023) TaxID=3038163 RepID=UPI0024155B2E|nr:tautomerase family protein [Mycobacterium sp. 236(2023)]MDG4668782.1 tautomerase family protein [Mycobacterium sp. 236(2023)]